MARYLHYIVKTSKMNNTTVKIDRRLSFNAKNVMCKSTGGAQIAYRFKKDQKSFNERMRGHIPDDSRAIIKNTERHYFVMWN